MTDRKMNENALIFKGVEIRAIGERMNLTDMWKAAGSDPSKLPAKWQPFGGHKRICRLHCRNYPPEG